MKVGVIKSWRGTLHLGASVTVSGLLVYYLILNSQKMVQLASQLETLDAFFCVIFLALAYAVVGLRLKMLGGFFSLDLSSRYVLLISYAGFFLNQITPTGFGGDALKLYLLEKQTGLKKSFSIILIDRLIGLFILSLLTLALVLASLLNLSFQPLDSYTLGIVFIIVISLLFLTNQIFKFLRLLTIDYKSHPYVLSLLSAFDLISKPHVAFISVIFFALNVIALSFCFLSLGIKLEMFSLITFASIFFFSSAIPLSYGPWGVREFFAIIFGPSFGVSSQEALMVSMVFGLCLFISACPGGVMLLLLKQQMSND